MPIPVELFIFAGKSLRLICVGANSSDNERVQNCRHFSKVVDASQQRCTPVAMSTGPLSQLRPSVQPANCIRIVASVCADTGITLTKRTSSDSECLFAWCKSCSSALSAESFSLDGFLLSIFRSPAAASCFRALTTSCSEPVSKDTSSSVPRGRMGIGKVLGAEDGRNSHFIPWPGMGPPTTVLHLSSTTPADVGLVLAILPRPFVTSGFSSSPSALSVRCEFECRADP